MDTQGLLLPWERGLDQSTADTVRRAGVSDSVLELEKLMSNQSAAKQTLGEAVDQQWQNSIESVRESLNNPYKFVDDGLDDGAQLWSLTDIQTANLIMRQYPKEFKQTEFEKIQQIENDFRTTDAVRKGKVGFLEAMEKNYLTPLGPFGIINPYKQLWNAISAYGAKQKLESGSGDFDDELNLLNYLDWQKEQQLRGSTIGATVGSGLTEMAGFATEMVLTGGVAGLAKKGVSTGLKSAVKESLRKSFVGKLAEKSLRVAAEAGTRTIATAPIRVAGEFAGEQLEGGYIETPEGIQINAASDTPATDLVKAFGSSFISYATEMAGGMLRWPKKFVPKSKAGQFFARLVGEIPQLQDEAKGGFLTAARFNSIVGELGENELEPIVRAVFGVGDYESGADLYDRIKSEWGTFGDFLVRSGTTVIGAGLLAGVGKLSQKIGELEDKHDYRRMVDEIAAAEIAAEDQTEKIQLIEELSNDQEGQRGLEGREPQGEELGRTIQEQETGGEAAPTSGVLQAPQVESLYEKLAAKERSIEEIDDALRIEETQTKSAEATITGKQLRSLYGLARNREVTKDQLHEMTLNMFGKSSLRDLTKAEASKLISELRPLKPEMIDQETVNSAVANVIGLSSNDYARIRSASGNNASIVNDVLMSTGKNFNAKIPQTDLKKKIVDGMVRQAADVRRYRKRVEVDKRLTLLNPWASMVQSVSDAEQKSGLPLLENIYQIYTGKRQTHVKFKEMIDAIFNRIGESPDAIARKQFNEANIQDALYYAGSERGNEAYQRMTDDEKKIYDSLAEHFRQLAPFVRAARFLNWLSRDTFLAGQKQTKQVKEKRKDLPPRDIEEKDQQRILDEGKKALANGNFSEWINQQSFGAREAYYMSESEFDELEATSPLPNLNFLEAARESGLGYLPSELQTREYSIGPSRKDLFPAVMAHTYRVILSAKTIVPELNFWQKWSQTIHAPIDTKRLQEYFANVHRTSMETSPIVRGLMKMSGAWWKFYFLQPSNSLFFAARNLLQNIALGPLVIGKREGTAALVKLMTNRAPTMTEDYAQNFKNDVLQKTEIINFYELEKKTAIKSQAGWSEELKRKANQILDTVAELAMVTDDVNRQTLWGVAYQSAYDWTEKWMKGEASIEKVYDALQLDTMPPAQVRILEKRLANNDVRGFINWYAEMKTLQVNFGYDTALRSLAEQKASSRLIMGVASWARGYIEAMYNGVVHPWIEGIRTKNYHLIRRATSRFIGAIASMFIADEISRFFLGDRDRGGSFLPMSVILGYTPLSPGLSTVTSLWEQVHQTQIDIANGMAVADVIGGFMRRSSYIAEHFLPLSDVIINAARIHDPRTKHVWEAIQKEITGRPGRRDWREGYQVWQSWFFDSWKQKPRRPQKGSVQSLLDDLFNDVNGQNESSPFELVAFD